MKPTLTSPMKINITYPIDASYTIQIERDKLPENPDDLFNSITKDELIQCVVHETIIEWDQIKCAWRYTEFDDIRIQDEDCNELYTLTENDKEERNRS